MLTAKDYKFANLALQEAQESPCQFRHGAVISIGKKLLAKGEQ